LVQEAVRDGTAKRAAVGAVVAGGALSAAKLGWDRAASRKDPRRFRLREGEPVSDGLIRIALGQLDEAIEQLERGSEEAIHEARKSFKRLRAVVRLARDQLGDVTYGRENRAFRDLGRRLSGARDSRVLLETLDAVAGIEPPPDLRGSFATEHAIAERQLTRDAIPDEVVQELRQVRELIAAWPLEQDGIESLSSGFRRVYRRARRAYRRAERDPTVENLHELRKRTKDVWYCCQILRPASPKRMKPLARDAHKLSDLIGEEHDLAILAERVEEIPDQPDTRELLGVIRRRREKLLGELLALGQRLFRKKPRKVARPLQNTPA
jgi:CHAD domain-containing protein